MHTKLSRKVNGKRQEKKREKCTHHDIEIELKFTKSFRSFFLLVIFSFSLKLGMKYANGSNEHIKAKTVFISRYLKPFMRSLNYLYAVLRDHCCYSYNKIFHVHNGMWKCKIAIAKMEKNYYKKNRWKV